ncbi:MAG TPA: AraC family transcriptional regulator ligand-binding domain-containing protein [Polyangiaceae bacterium]|jgi:AraC-like DNA-binding protein|nr:AraC family transcriptional regulator ligand-binding domain-containing protein [Polyangiaceae bacterium]
MQGSISVQTVRGYLALSAGRGLDVGAVKEAVGVDGALDDIDARVPWPLCERLGREIVSRIGVEGAVDAMAAMGESTVGILYFVARHSGTVGLALQRIAQYYGVTSSIADCDLVDDGSPVRLELRQRSYVGGPIRHLISGLWSVANVATLRQMVGPEFTPLLVELEMSHPGAGAVRAYEDALRCPLRFDALRSAVAVPADLLTERVVGANQVLEAAAMKYAADVLGRVDSEESHTLRGRLRGHMLGGIHSGDLALGPAARHLGTTGRTLQRRLREEGTSFQEVLDEVRRDVALGQMRAKRQSIDEVAFVLGFEKSSSFQRAFKRWTGLTPVEFRKHGQTEAPLALG